MTKPLKINASAAVLEQVIVGLSFFIIYGVLYRQAGAERVGILSLVMIMANLGSMAGAGFASALSHFVPKLESEGRRKETIEYIDTTILCSIAIYIVVLGIIYVPFVDFIGKQVGLAHTELVNGLAPLAVIYTLFLGVGSANSLILTALQRNDLRLWSTGIGAIVGLAVLVICAPSYGIVGGALAMNAQVVTTTFMAWLQLTKILPELGPMPSKFGKSTARKVVNLGTNVQVQTLLLAAIEPTTRLFLGHFGSLSAVADFSLASRFVIQVRALIFSGAQPLLSAFSHQRNNPSKLAYLYGIAQTTVTTLAIIIFSGAIAAAPFIQEIWTGDSSGKFTVFVIWLAIGWMANTLTLPAYFNSYSLGKMNGSLFGHMILCFINIIFGAGLAFRFGSDGAVAGMAAALIISAILLGHTNGRFTPIEAPPPFNWRDAALLVLGIFAAAIGLNAYLVLRSNMPPIFAGIACGIIWAALLSPALLFNDVLRATTTKLRIRIGRKN
ncbi:lipopolysaccharide biosynthesis protein [Methylocucumis oryzae]|uniref:Uncharacterized protein n=1 Tax=Methylocucumis oryzae TaxID=1632867 RepID=A0A0F3IHP6_9GAMM|nr:polysaccharide biosynthesis C-terminal domain-containing protein [Methylocucumis oryzae]KJV04989.1 hypothetical protein VZ94_21415 [Methylocucumis oryzae]